MKNNAVANAPEVDHTLLAPQYRGDNDAPEMAVGQGMQLNRDNPLPEVVKIESSEDSSRILSDDAVHAQKSNRRRLILILAILTLIAAVLGLGLGLVLSRKDKNDTNQPTASPSISGSSTTVSMPTQPVATDIALQHNVLTNTSIAATTLSNGLRHVYFQEKSGAIRRAIYFPQASLWQASADSSLVTGAKANTPLAVARWLNYRDRTNWVTLFYVNTTNNALGCAHWKKDSPSECSVLDSIPESTVAEGSRQISATVLSNDIAQGGLLLTYQDSSGQFVIMYGFSDTKHGITWSWRNQTDLFNSVLSGESTDYQITEACSSTWDTEGPHNVFYLYCFVKTPSVSAPSSGFSHVSRFKVFIERSAPYNITIDSVDISDVANPTAKSDIIVLSDASKSENGTLALWSVPLAMQSFPNNGTLPSPRSQFPYDRLAATFGRNKTMSYIYHQSNDSTITEDAWDDDKRVWTSNFFTIETS